MQSVQKSSSSSLKPDKNVACKQQPNFFCFVFVCFVLFLYKPIWTKILLLRQILCFMDKMKICVHQKKCNISKFSLKWLSWCWPDGSNFYHIFFLTANANVKFTHMQCPNKVKLLGPKEKKICFPYCYSTDLVNMPFTSHQIVWLKTFQAEIPFTNNTHEAVTFVCWESQSRTTQNEQATHHWWLLPRRCCSNHGPVLDVLAQRTSHLDYALFVKGTVTKL